MAVVHQLAGFSNPPRLAECPLPQFLEIDANRIINSKGLD